MLPKLPFLTILVEDIIKSYNLNGYDHLKIYITPTLISLDTMDSTLQLLKIIAGPLIALLLVYFLLWKPKFTKSKEAPEPAGAWPVIGHLLKLLGKDLPHVKLGAMADKYGAAFTIRIGMIKALVVSDSEVAKECFTTNDIVFATRPRVVATKHLSYDYAMFGFAPYGPYWREIRKIVVLELLSSKRIQLLKDVTSSEIGASIKELYEVWEHNQGKEGLALVEMKRWLGDLTLNVVLRMVVGKRHFSRTTTGSDGGESQRCLKAMRNFFRLAGLFNVSDIFPFLERFDLQGYERELKATARELDTIFTVWFKEHKVKRYNGGTEEEQDFMDAMLSAFKESRFPDFDDETIIKATCMILVAGAADTNMVAITWALSLLVNNPQVLRKAQNELDTHVGKERQADKSDITNLVYLQAIVKETLRLYPTDPLLGQHEATEDCTLAGYHVPAGTRLIVNLWKIQRDPSLWSNPTEFQPERFLETNIDIGLNGQHFELFPFGSGRRVCPGTSFALQVVHLTLANLIHGFELRAPNGPVDMTESAGLTNMKATPLEVLIKARLQPIVYGSFYNQEG
ncbi:hypothetical protein GIB67_017572 [Kingdonia uniflora]|uniref:Cytochrome P450 n=1 Tax=Kingdonia uniflora TaxID=39325 RepID=A0A7J7LN97_9MAGN|nr:hypothetical protein GIB67_017572 [Kingdonia uniflora]